jgi:hypothetical protein
VSTSRSNLVARAQVLGRAATAWSMCVAACAILGCAILGTGTLGAQGLAHGGVQGAVRDDAGRPIADTEIRLTERGGGALRTAVTARDGSFRFNLVAPGAYDLAAEALGFRPVVISGLSVAAGAVSAVRVTLPRQAPPVTRIDTIVAVGTRAAPLHWLQERGYADLVGGSRLATDLVGLAPSADERAVEGLSWRHADVLVDGAHASPFVAPTGGGLALLGTPVPSRGVAGSRVGGLGFDVEVGGSGVGLALATRRGGAGTRPHASVFGGTSDFGGGADGGGPIQRDTAYVVGGIDVVRAEIARPAFLPATDAAGTALAAAALGSHGVSLAPYQVETKQLAERASAFGRLDWQQGDRFTLTMRAAGARTVSADPPLAGGIAAGLGSRHEANAVQASVNVVARLTSRVAAEVRAAADFGEATAAQGPIPTTSFAGRGLTLGGASAEPFTESRTTPRLHALAHFDLGAHQVKVGAVVASHRAEGQGGVATGSAFRFGDVGDFAAASGAWRGLAGPVHSGTFRTTEMAWLVQDAWRLADGLDLLVGARFDRQRLPLGDLDANAEWLARTGMDNRAVDASTTRFAPRIAFRWEMGAARDWVLDGGAGIFHDVPQARDLAEALALDRGVDVRLAVGALGGWPAAPDSATAPVVGRTAALLGPEFEGPRTRRIALGIQRDLGTWSAYVRGTYRQTDFLARRRDLNLPVASAGRDQYGRPLQGGLRQVGSLLAADPGSNRRFPEFDAVHALEVTGYSEYWGATAGVETVREAGLSGGVHYTFSRTWDNLAGPGALAPLPLEATGREWSDGVADTDVPHRVIAAAEWRAGPTGPLRIGAVYRLQSGTPFTPGFRDGVDANADGVWGNDPAFVDGALPGMNVLVDAFPCLRQSLGRLAARNSCRGEWTHRLDLRAAIRLGALAGSSFELTLDALDILPSEAGRVDAALLLVDRTRSIVTAPATGVRTVPYVVNPAFGTILADRASGMLFRAGLRIGR